MDQDDSFVRIASKNKKIVVGMILTALLTIIILKFFSELALGFSISGI